MDISALRAWHAFNGVVSINLTVQEIAVLIILAICLLVFRTFRERYLLVWILAWMAYFVSLWAANHRAWANLTPAHMQAISYAGFVLAIGLFATGVFIYTHVRDLVVPLLVISFAVAAYAVTCVLLWPDAITLRVALEVAYRIIAVAAAIQLVRFRWARADVGAWLISASLLALHLDWAPSRVYLTPMVNLTASLALGLGMLFIVFDNSRIRTRRLAVVNALTLSITRAQQHGPMMATALEELKALMGAKAAWFRLLEDNRMVITQQIGLSDEYQRDRGSVSIDETLTQALREDLPMVIKTSTANESLRPHLRRERFHHIVILPVSGKKSIIGTLVLGSRRWLSYTPDELEFLKNTAQQLGMAVENLQLVEQILFSHRQWSNTFDSIHDCVLVHDASFRVIKANRALLLRLGQAPADVRDRLCEEILPNTYDEWKKCPFCLGTEEDDFHEGPDPCFGGYSMVSTSFYTDQATSQKGTIHVVRDVTDRRVAEEKYGLLFEQAQEGVFVATPEGKLLDCNQAFVRMLGHSSHTEVMALNLDNEIYAFAEQRDALHKEMEQNSYVRNFEVTLRRKNGSLLTAMESSFATRDAEGKIERYQGFLLDITEKKLAEDEIRRRNRELNALNTMAMIATQSFDLDEILNLTLRQVITLLGVDAGSIYLCDADATTYRRRAGWGQLSADRGRLAEVKFPGGFGDLVTRSRTEVITAEYLPHLPKPVVEFIQAETTASWIWVLLWGKDAAIGIMGISARESRVYSSNDENLLVAIGRQLSTTIEKVRLYEETCRAYEDVRHTQAQLLQSEKMSAVGQLIAGVAHELNNPLTAILGYAQLLEGEGLNERAANFVDKLFRQAQRTHRVVQNLLSFAQQRKPQKQEVDIRKVLDETFALRDYDLKVNDIEVERESEAAVPVVIADPHQIEQVFLNIINNAVDAILEAGHGGTLRVRVYAKDEHVHIEFRDSGAGIKDVKRIFDPFYTTKLAEKNTGLGLSICYGIVKEHGGEIAASNLPEGRGALVEVSLPSAGKMAVGESAAPVPARKLAIDGNILLVENEEAVLEFERDVLAGAGARVTPMMNGEAVKQRLLQESYDALIIDGKLPGGWNAVDIYQWIMSNRPSMENHVLFTFSTIAEPEIREFLQQHNVPYLAKPFEVGDLISQARAILQRVQAAVAE